MPLMVSEAIEALRARLRHRITVDRFPVRRIAREAGLHPNTLYTFEGDWKPTHDTLVRLEAWLNGKPLPPKERRQAA